jgi:hypothetical protein
MAEALAGVVLHGEPEEAVRDAGVVYTDRHQTRRRTVSTYRRP